ncbi:sugar-binding transcriptional regulator [Pelagibius sp. Alg239-R121]|uniref:sugar-binding transcriptional regulator n=1 Tax=Pelagibius sp. Alg239-R121 TaxID=2993448 RepID=UPI0024A7512B|nr:sugar-binding transcriptional regulator [Pelagibius sp. Alg239-R121]
MVSISNSDTRESSDPQDWPEQLAVRIAWCYYVLGMTQQEIATRVGVNRTRVIRLLAEARRRGVVSISINSKLTENVELAEALAERFKLDLAEVTLAYTEDEDDLSGLVGAAACEPVLRRLKNGMTIGLGWGVTLKAFAQAMPETPMRDVSVVPLLGSLTRRSSIAAFEATTELAGKLRAECLYLPGPIVCDTEEGRDILFKQPLLQEIYKRALNSELAIVSVGGLNSATIRRVDFVNDADFASVRAAGAIGNFLGYYIGSEAEVIDHPVNRRVIGLHPREFIKIRQRIMISGGENKVAALSAILERGLVTGLVTDQKTARALLEQAAGR